MKTKLLLSGLLLIALNTFGQLPDFKTGISYSFGYDQNSMELNLTWDFFNVGGSTNTTFTIAYIASTDLNIDASDYLIGSKAYSGAVASAFATVTFTYGFSPGDLPNGQYKFIVYLDYGNKVNESNENNNIVSFGTFNFNSGASGISSANANSDAFSIYPNPGSDFIRVKQNSTSEMTFFIYDTMGKEVMSGKVSDAIDVRSLASGAYSLRLSNADGTVATRRIMIR